MHKLVIAAALVLPLGSLAIAKCAVDDLPQQVDADGHLLRMRIEGAGSPTVVFEIGIGGPLEEWGAVQPEVARFAKTVAYDRIGANHRQDVLTGADVARELHAALEKANLPPPYVLVGQSFGGVYNEIFASMYPGEVAGMVLLDSPTKKFANWVKMYDPKEDFTSTHHSDWPEANGILPTFDELRAGGPQPDVPVVVVTCARPTTEPRKIEMLKRWTAWHAELANRYPQGQHIVTEKSGHGIQVEQPELVIDLIREVVERARGTSPPSKPASGDSGSPG